MRTHSRASDVFVWITCAFWLVTVAFIFLLPAQDEQGNMPPSPLKPFFFTMLGISAVLTVICAIWRYDADAKVLSCERCCRPTTHDAVSEQRASACGFDVLRQLASGPQLYRSDSIKSVSYLLKSGEVEKTRYWECSECGGIQARSSWKRGAPRALSQLPFISKDKKETMVSDRTGLLERDQQEEEDNTPPPAYAVREIRTVSSCSGIWLAFAVALIVFTVVLRLAFGPTGDLPKESAKAVIFGVSLAAAVFISLACIAALVEDFFASRRRKMLPCAGACDAATKHVGISQNQADDAGFEPPPGFASTQTSLREPVTHAFFSADQAWCVSNGIIMHNSGYRRHLGPEGWMVLMRSHWTCDRCKTIRVLDEWRRLTQDEIKREEEHLRRGYHPGTGGLFNPLNQRFDTYGGITLSTSS